MDTKVFLTFEQAVARMSDDDKIQVVIPTGPDGSIHLSADWDRADLLEKMRRHQVEATGPVAHGMGFGLAFHDDHSWYFVRTEPVADGVA